MDMDLGEESYLFRFHSGNHMLFFKVTSIIVFFGVLGTRQDSKLHHAPELQEKRFRRQRVFCLGTL